MRVTDELDAMRVMGISHSYRLVMPRAMALAIAMPLISAWTTVAGLIGGMVAADLSLGISPMLLPQRAARRGEPAEPGAGHCQVGGVRHPDRADRLPLRPARASPTRRAWAQGTTASVVTAITVVILVDALFAVLFSNVGI